MNLRARIVLPFLEPGNPVTWEARDITRTQLHYYKGVVSSPFLLKSHNISSYNQCPEKYQAGFSIVPGLLENSQEFMEHKAGDEMLYM
jgi:hypothetical protein